MIVYLHGFNSSARSHKACFFADWLAARGLDVTTIRPQRYLLLVETGDEVLDYRKAVEKYRGARQVVVAGGDHSLMSFPDHLSLIVEFAQLDPSERPHRL